MPDVSINFGDDLSFGLNFDYICTISSGQSTDRTTFTSFMLMSIANGFIQRYKSDYVEIIQRKLVDMSKSFKVTH